MLDWGVFAAAVVLTMLLDFALFGRTSHRISFREASVRSVLWIVVSLAFAGWVQHRMGSEKAVSYVVAYLVEKSLSVDNLFVFLVIFTYFRVKEEHQSRVLFWGVFGAVVMRAIFILAGTALLHRFHFTMYVFGAFLVFTGIKLAFKSDESVDLENNLALRLARKYLRTTKEFSGEKFFVIKDGVRHATPLFLVVIVVEFTDVIFAVDSVPAVLAISSDLFVVYTSNIFAIMGLRALYFMLSGMMSRFHYLDIGLAVILVFIGAKMLGADFYKIPNFVSLGVMPGGPVLAVGASLLKPVKRQEPS